MRQTQEKLQIDQWKPFCFEMNDPKTLQEHNIKDPDTILRGKRVPVISEDPTK